MFKDGELLLDILFLFKYRIFVLSEFFYFCLEFVDMLIEFFVLLDEVHEHLLVVIRVCLLGRFFFDLLDVARGCILTEFIDDV